MKTDDTSSVAKFVGPTDGETLNVVGDTVRILADARSTGGRVTIIEERSLPGISPPLHRHTLEDEYFFVTKGRYKFVCDGKEFLATPGAFVCAPKGSTHTFVSCAEDGGESRMIIVCTPSGLEKPFRTCHAGGPGMAIDDVVKVFDEHKLTFVGPLLTVPTNG